MRTEIPPILAAGPPFLLFILYLIPASLRAKRWFILPYLAGFVVLAIFPVLRFSSHNPAGDFGLGSNAVVYCLILLDRIFMSDLDKDFVPPGSSKVPEPGTWARFWWALRLAHTFRGPGWKFQVRNTPVLHPKYRPKLRFLLLQFGRFTKYYLIIDALTSYHRTVGGKYFLYGLPLSALTFPERVLFMATGGIMGVAALNTIYILGCIACVSIGLSESIECPNLFGNLSDIATMSGFWGIWWHQMFRRLYSQPVVLIYRLIGGTKVKSTGTNIRLPRATFVWKMISLFLPFTLSGFHHLFAMRCITETWEFELFWFFAIQPVGIILQNVFLDLFASRSTRHVLGTTTTLLWMVSTAHLFVDPLVQAGIWTVNAAPVSIVRGAMNVLSSR